MPQSRNYNEVPVLNFYFISAKIFTIFQFFLFYLSKRGVASHSIHPSSVGLKWLIGRGSLYMKQQTVLHSVQENIAHYYFHFTGHTL